MKEKLERKMSIYSKEFKEQRRSNLSVRRDMIQESSTACDIVLHAGRLEKPQQA